MNREQISKLVADEISKIEQDDLVQAIQALLIEPREELRDWSYGEPEEKYPCWIVVEHLPTKTGIAFCEHGFGPEYPWGLLFVTEPPSSLGMDSQWFISLEEAMRGAMFWEGENPAGYEVQ